MKNFLVTYSPFSDYGFLNELYLLAPKSIDISDIEKFEHCAVFVPYDYKNQIELKCFCSTNVEMPKIFPVEKSISFKNIEDIKGFLTSDDNLCSGKNTDAVLFEQVYYEEYEKSFLKIQDYLKKGDIYEVNYCIPFVFKDIEISPVELFLELVPIMKAPFTALLKMENEYILSFSPERFLKRISDIIYTEPIKGTAPRGSTPEEDKINREHLKNSLKEQTENAMIVDVSRNDLSRIAQKGSVIVEELFAIKSYATVHQMASKISCKIRKGVSFKDIIHATFPMASMTGAPKIRAMQIAEELEKYPRRYYSGTLGIYKNGDFDLSVLIRSIFYDRSQKELRIWAGSAITLYAHPEQEYAECLLKAQRLIQGIKNFSYFQKK